MRRWWRRGRSPSAVRRCSPASASPATARSGSSDGDHLPPALRSGRKRQAAAPQAGAAGADPHDPAQSRYAARPLRRADGDPHGDRGPLWRGDRHDRRRRRARCRRRCGWRGCCARPRASAPNSISLADFVNFGVAPAIILYVWALDQVRSLGWIAALVFSICAALRLARFNVAIDGPTKPDWHGNFFTGVPAPAGALIVLLPVYLGQSRCPGLRIRPCRSCLHLHRRRRAC